MESATSTSRSTTTVWTKSSPISAVGRPNIPKGSSIDDANRQRKLADMNDKNKKRKRELA